MSETLEAEGSFREVRRPVKYKTRSRIDRKAILSHHHTRPLDSLKNILGEHARVYRSVINGILTPLEGVRLSYILREVRGSMEAVMAQEARDAALAKEAAAIAAQATQCPLIVNVMSVPEGHYYHPEDGSFHPDAPQLEHVPTPESPPIEPEPAPARPSLRLVELEHELSQLTDEELLRRVADAVPR